MAKENSVLTKFYRPGHSVYYCIGITSISRNSSGKTYRILNIV